MKKTVPKSAHSNAPAAKEEAGAPSVLRRLSADAREAEELMDVKKAEIIALRAVKETAAVSRKIAQCEMELAGAKDEYIKLAKTLLPYDKGISLDRREGEKVAVADVREWFAQFLLSIDSAIENYIIANSQSAALADSPEVFHAAHAENLRAAKENALAAAVREKVLPKWVL